MEKVVIQQQLTSYYSGKKIFITGHTGFKGSWLQAWLQLLGGETMGYALPPEYDDCLYNLHGSWRNGKSILADIRDRKKLEHEIISFEPDYIFHLAAQPLVRRSYQLPSETFEVNAIGTANLLEAVHKLPKKCTVVIVTTDKVYENKEKDILYKEGDSLGGHDPYSASKACTEIVVNSFRSSFFNYDQYGNHLKAIATARAGNVIGGGDMSEDRIVPDIIRALKEGEPIRVRNPLAVRPWQHVIEPLGGYLLLGGLLNDDPGLAGPYNFGPKKFDHLTVKELVELSIKAWGTGTWEDTSDNTQPHEAGLLKLDISKAKKVLNWQPNLSASEAINWTINWYKKPKTEAAIYTLEQINSYMNI